MLLSAQQREKKPKHAAHSAAGGPSEQEEAAHIRGSYCLLSAAAALRCPPERRTSTSFTLWKTRHSFGIPYTGRSALIFKASPPATLSTLHGLLPLLELSLAEVERNRRHRFARESVQSLSMLPSSSPRGESSRSHSEPWERNHICLAR